MDYNDSEGDRIVASGDFSNYTFGTSVNNRGNSDILDTVVRYNGDIIAVVVDNTDIVSSDFESTF